VASNTGRVIRARNTIIVDAGGRTVFAVTESRDLEPVPAHSISLLLPPSGGKRPRRFTGSIVFLRRAAVRFLGAWVIVFWLLARNRRLAALLFIGLTMNWALNPTRAVLEPLDVTEYRQNVTA